MQNRAFCTVACEKNFIIRQKKNGSKNELAMDMWEDAFLVYYVPAEKVKYVEAFLGNVYWEVAEERFKKI